MAKFDSQTSTQFITWIWV